MHQACLQMGRGSIPSHEEGHLQRHHFLVSRDWNRYVSSASRGTDRCYWKRIWFFKIQHISEYNCQWNWNIIFLLLFFLSVLVSNDPRTDTGPWPGGWVPCFVVKMLGFVPVASTTSWTKKHTQNPEYSNLLVCDIYILPKYVYSIKKSGIIRDLSTWWAWCHGLHVIRVKNRVFVGIKNWTLAKVVLTEKHFNFQDCYHLLHRGTVMGSPVPIIHAKLFVGKVWGFVGTILLILIWGILMISFFCMGR